MGLVPSVLEHDGLVLRALVPEDAALLGDLAHRPATSGLLEPTLRSATIAELIGQLLQWPWSRPMVCLRHGEPVGALINPFANVNSLNTQVVALLTEPERDRIALAMYVRHLYWSFPAHRAFAEIPASRADLAAALDWAGFRHEGTLPDHVRTAGALHDVAVYGQLRREFDDWAARELPALAFPAAR